MDMSSGSYSLSTKGRTTSVLTRGLVSCSSVYGSSIVLLVETIRSRIHRNIERQGHSPMLAIMSARTLGYALTNQHAV